MADIVNNGVQVVSPNVQVCGNALTHFFPDTTQTEINNLYNTENWSDTYTYGSSPSTSSKTKLVSNFSSPSTGDIVLPPAEIINVTMKVTNDEDSGNLGYWALDNYQKHITVWQTGPNTFNANVTYAGTWQTFAGTLSPGNGVIEPVNGNGVFVATYDSVFTGTLLQTPMESTVGNLGTFDFGGTASDILLGKYPSNGGTQVGDTNFVNWASFYFENPATILNDFYSAP